MEVNVKDLGTGEVELAVTATAEETERALQEGCRSFTGQFGGSFDPADPVGSVAKVAGGNDPAQIVRMLTLAGLIPHAVTQAQIMPIAEPKPTEGPAPLAGAPFSFTLHAYPRPAFELSSYEPVAVEIEGTGDVTDEEVDEQLRRMVAMIDAEAPADVSELTDEWVRAHMEGSGLGSVADMRDSIRAASREVKERQLEARRRTAVVNAYAERLQGDAPYGAVAAFADEMMVNMEMQVVGSGDTMENVLKQQGLTPAIYRANMEQEAANLLRGLFALDALLRHEGLSVTREDLQAAAESMAPGDEDALEVFERTGRMFLVRETAERNVALTWALEHAQITVGAKGANRPA